MAERKSSIHIIKSSPAALIHNERVYAVDYAIDDDSRNFYSRIRSPRQYRNAAIKDYTDDTGQKYQKVAAPIREGVINLLPHHTIEDVKRLAKMLHDKYGIEPLHIAIHNDEGHIVDGEKIYNHHAHIVFGWHDFITHRSVKLTPMQMRKMQDDVAKHLGMQRGKVGSERRRLNNWEYKEAMAMVNEATAPLLLTIDEMKEAVNELRDELKAEKAKRPQYAALEQFKKDIEAQMEAGDLITREKFEEETAKLRAELEEQIEQLRQKDEEIEQLKAQVVAAPAPDYVAALEADRKKKKELEERRRRDKEAAKKLAIAAGIENAADKDTDRINPASVMNAVADYLPKIISRLKHLEAQIRQTEKHQEAAAANQMQQRQAERRIERLEAQLQQAMAVIKKYILDPGDDVVEFTAQQAAPTKEAATGAIDSAVNSNVKEIIEALYKRMPASARDVVNIEEQNKPEQSTSFKIG